MQEDGLTGNYFLDINSLAQWLVRDGDESVSLVLDPTRDGSTQPQYDRAKKLQDGDVLLSYVKGVRCWTGVSVIRTNTDKSHKKPLNPVESADAWSQHFGHALDIQPRFGLYEPDLCFFSTNERLGVQYQGRGIYKQMHRLDDCERIMKKVERLHAMTIESAREEAAGEGLARDLDGFVETWRKVLKRDPYLTEIAVTRSGGRCNICGTTSVEWVERLQRKQPDQSYRNVFDDSPYGYTFLEGHHERPCAHQGDARLENLLALCPNCHRVVSRNIDALHKDEKRAK